MNYYYPLLNAAILLTNLVLLYICLEKYATRRDLWLIVAAVAFATGSYSAVTHLLMESYARHLVGFLQKEPIVQMQRASMILEPIGVACYAASLIALLRRM